MNPKDWYFEVYQEFEFARTQYRMTATYRGQKFYASHLIADEQLYYMSPTERKKHIDKVREMLRKNLEKAMLAYDKENPVEPTKFIAHTYPVSSEWVTAQAEMYDHIKYAYQAMIKWQLDASYEKPQYIKPRDVYRENAASEFEGVEDLDPTLWNEDGDELI